MRKGHLSWDEWEEPFWALNDYAEDLSRRLQDRGTGGGLRDRQGPDHAGWSGPQLSRVQEVPERRSRGCACARSLATAVGGWWVVGMGG